MSIFVFLILFFMTVSHYELAAGKDVDESKKETTGLGHVSSTQLELSGSKKGHYSSIYSSSKSEVKHSYSEAFPSHVSDSQFQEINRSNIDVPSGIFSGSATTRDSQHLPLSTMKNCQSSSLSEYLIATSSIANSLGSSLNSMHQISGFSGSSIYSSKQFETSSAVSPNFSGSVTSLVSESLVSSPSLLSDSSMVKISSYVNLNTNTATARNITSSFSPIQNASTLFTYSYSSTDTLANASSQVSDVSSMLSFTSQIIPSRSLVHSTDMVPIKTNSSVAPTSIYPSIVTSEHWRTVTVCPWDTLYTAGIATTISSELLTISPFVNRSSIQNVSNISILPTSSPNVSSAQPLASYSIVSNQSDIEPIAKKGCDVVLDGLSKVMGEMSSCIIGNLRPLQVCKKCTQFHSALRRYQNLIANTKGCSSELIMEYNAQYQAIPKMYKVQDELWRDFECEKCYKSRTDTDPNAAWVPKEEFVKTMSLVKEIMVCFANYSKDEINLPYPVMLNVSEKSNSTSWKSNTKICIKCKDAYKTLKKYMRSIHFEGSAEKRWCADMVYGFNETRRIWRQFCVSTQESEESIIALTCFFCFLPVVFYVGTKLHSDVKERKNAESRVNYESD